MPDMREARAAETTEALQPKDERDDLAWTPEEIAAMDGSADAAAKQEESVLRGDDAGDGEVRDEETEEDAAAGGDDPAAFIDTRERKASYTPEEYAQLVRQRDYFQNQTKRLETEIGTVNERVGRIAEALEKKEEPEPPSKADDPAGYLDHRLDGVAAKVDQVATSLEERKQMEAAAANQKAFEEASRRAMEAHVAETNQTAEGFNAKLVKLRQERYQDFLDEGFEEERAWAMLVGWENQIISSAFRRNENPATVLDRLFQRRGLAVEAPAGGGNGEAPVEAGPGPSAEELVTRAKEGVRQQKPQNEGIRRGKSFKITYDVLSRMPPEEFEEVMAKIEGTSKEVELDATGSTSIVL